MNGGGKNKREVVFKEILAESFFKLMKVTNRHIDSK